MRRFRLIAEDGEYVGGEKGHIYDENLPFSDTNRPVKYYVEMYPEDWQEVFEPVEPVKGRPFTDIPKPVSVLHKDTDLGHYTSVALNGLDLNDYADAFGNEWAKAVAKDAIILAKELIKQLDKEVGGGK